MKSETGGVDQIFLLLLLAVIGVNAFAGQGEQRVEALGWMSGRWVGTFEGLPFETYYTGTDGGMMLGVSKQLRAGKVSLFELEQFVTREGQVILVPHPFGRASKDVFRLTDFDMNVQKARFISPEHDFPTEIIYERIGDRLRVIVAGEQGGKRIEAVAELVLQ